MTAQDLYLKVIELNPTHPLAYLYLARTLSSFESIKLGDGIEMTQLELVRKATDLDPEIKDVDLDFLDSIDSGG